MEPVKLPAAPFWPFTAFHPVYGGRTANDQIEADAMFIGSPSDWFASAAEADAARTQREAELVVAHEVHNRLADALEEAQPDETPPLVENSVTAAETAKAGAGEP